MTAAVASDPPGTPWPAADVGIVFALDVEADAFERMVKGRRHTRGDRFTFSTGIVAARSVAWCVCGAGAEAAAAATRHLVDGHRPRTLITAGFAGGLDPDLRRGSAVRPRFAVRLGDERRVALASPPGVGIPVAGSTIVTVDAIAASVEAKRALAARTGGHLVDMETFAVAEAAAAAGLPCVAVRVISDDAGETLPGEVATLAAPQSAWHRIGAAVGAVGRRPAAALDLWRLWERSVVDARTLADAVAEVIRESG